jgi:hypothetical protein
LRNRLFSNILNPINFSTVRAFSRWRPAAVLRVTGEDAFSFLQGQFTNDLRALEREAEAVYGLWLTVKGKVVADSFVLRLGDGAWGVVSYFSAAAAIRERLESFVIADDVTIADETGAWVGGSFLGSAPPERPAGVFAWTGRRVRDGNREWLVPAAEEAAVRARLGGWEEWDAAKLESVRVATGVPAVPRDAGPGDLPNEAGLEGAAISYSKGCYLGQEVMARLRAMGQVRRSLVRVQLAGEAEPAGTPAALWQGERQVGELRSATPGPDGRGAVGLAMVSRLHVAAGAKLGFAAGAVPTVEVLELP